MNLRIIFLGTSGAIPSPDRNPSSIFLQYGKTRILFDCGEGTQRQMMRAKTGFNIDAIFITHLHTDHFIGCFGLIETMSLNGREKPLNIYSPQAEFLRDLFKMFGYNNLDFKIKVFDVKDGLSIRFDGFNIIAFKTEHIIESFGYAFVEDDHIKFDVEKAKSLGIPEGPLYSKLAKGEIVEFNGRIIKPEMVLGERIKGRKIVYTGDTAPIAKTIEIARDADILIHDSSFTSELENWAKETKHSTARAAGEIAKKARVKELILTHISARYSKNPEKIIEDAKSVFENVKVAEDFMVVELHRNKG